MARLPVEGSGYADGFENVMMRRPLVAILNGVRPDDIVVIADAIIKRGIKIIEVPLESQYSLLSIAHLRAAFDGCAMIAAGNVTCVSDVKRAAGVGAAIITSPNINTAVVREVLSAGLVSVPGVSTITEAYAAIEAGAHAIKAFPAEQIGPKSIAVWSKSLPPGTKILAVGGIDEHNIRVYRNSGATGLGLGEALYKPGFTVDDVGTRAARLCAAWEK